MASLTLIPLDHAGWEAMAADPAAAMPELGLGEAWRWVRRRPAA
jgi:hypothetical protein